MTPQVIVAVPSGRRSRCRRQRRPEPIRRDPDARLWDGPPVRPAPHPEVVQYIETIQDTLDRFGGRCLVHGPEVTVLEGEWPGTLVIIEFPDRDAATRWYESPAYQAILPYRTNNIDGAGDIQVIRPSDLVGWQLVDNALPTLPAWAVPGSTWAPSVPVEGRGGGRAPDAVVAAAHGRRAGRGAAGAPAGLGGPGLRAGRRGRAVAGAHRWDLPRGVDAAAYATCPGPAGPCTKPAGGRILTSGPRHRAAGSRSRRDPK